MSREQQPSWMDTFRIRNLHGRERVALSERVGGVLTKEEQLTEAGIRHLLREAKDLYRCADEKVAASLFMKRYAHPLAGRVMHAFSRLGQLLDPDKWFFTLTLDASGDIDVIGRVELEPYWAAEEHATAQERLLQEDRDWVLHEAAVALYGEYEANPLAFAYTVIPNPAQESKILRIREVCCLKFRSESGLHCTTCPHITERQRADICKLHQ